MYIHWPCYIQLEGANSVKCITQALYMIVSIDSVSNPKYHAYQMFT